MIALVVDGKQKAVSNEYAILTLSVLHRSGRVRRTTGSLGATRVMTRAGTTTSSPLAQALVDCESAENVGLFFQAVTA